MPDTVADSVRCTNETIALIMHILATEREVIPYRPELAKTVGGVTAAILLQQIQYWWTRQNFQPFYKFNAPCSHRFYRPGDSWAEELGFTRSNLLTARGRIAIKKPGGTTMQEARYRTMSSTRIKPVIFWTNAGRLTYYTIHPLAFIEVLRQSYLPETSEADRIRQILLGKSSENDVLKPESGFTKSRKVDLPKAGKWIYLKQESGFTISEITRDHTGEQQQQSDAVVVDGWDMANKFNPEQINAFNDLLRCQVQPQAAAELVEENTHQLGRVQLWIDYTEHLITHKEQEIRNPAGFIIAGLRSNEAALLPAGTYRYGEIDPTLRGVDQ